MVKLSHDRGDDWTTATKKKSTWNIGLVRVDPKFWCQGRSDPKSCFHFWLPDYHCFRAENTHCRIQNCDCCEADTPKDRPLELPFPEKQWKRNIWRFNELGILQHIIWDHIGATVESSYSSSAGYGNSSSYGVMARQWLTSLSFEFPKRSVSRCGEDTPHWSAGFLTTAMVFSQRSPAVGDWLTGCSARPLNEIAHRKPCFDDPEGKSIPSPISQYRPWGSQIE